MHTMTRAPRRGTFHIPATFSSERNCFSERRAGREDGRRDRNGARYWRRHRRRAAERRREGPRGRQGHRRPVGAGRGGGVLRRRRAGRHPGQLRRRRGRAGGPATGRGHRRGLARGRRRQPDDRVPVHPGGGAGNEGAALGADHHHRLLGRPGRQQDRHPGLHQRESGPDRLDPAAGPRTGPVRDHGQLHRARLHPVQPDHREAVGELRPDGQAALVEGISMRRLGEPADIANGVQFFASERSSWVTGQIIAIDGGHAGL